MEIEPRCKPRRDTIYTHWEVANDRVCSAAANWNMRGCTFIRKVRRTLSAAILLH